MKWPKKYCDISVTQAWLQSPVTWVSGWLGFPVLGLREAAGGLMNHSSSSCAVVTDPECLCWVEMRTSARSISAARHSGAPAAPRSAPLSLSCRSTCSCHVETRQEQESREEEQASTSDTVTSTSHRRPDEDEIIMSRSWLTACGVKCVLYLSSFEAHQDDGGVQFVQLRCILGEFAAFTFQTKLNQRI